jgi:RNA polymerase sigma-70 factor (ECF subfamily)
MTAASEPAVPLPGDRVTAAMDGKQFESSVVALLPDLFGAARHFARDATDAEDLVAEAVAKAWSALDTLHDPACFRPWILRILTNVYLADYRSRATRPQTDPLPDEDNDSFSLFEKLHQPFLLWWGNPEQDLLERLLRDDLDRAVAGLPDSFRQAVVLADMEGLSYADTAAALRVPVGTVRSRLARGRSLLQKALWEHALDAGLVDPRFRQTRKDRASA